MGANIRCWVQAAAVAAVVVGLAGCAPQGPTREMRRLNTLVTELAHYERVAAHEGHVVTFANPRDGWVFVTMTARAVGADWTEVTLLRNGARDVLFRKVSSGPNRLEAMRYLSAGPCSLSTHGQASGGAVPLIDSLTVRAIPELQYSSYPTQPNVAAHGPYDWAFLSRHVLPHVNTIIGSASEETSDRIDEWTARGGKWITHTGLIRGDDLTADAAYEYWAQNPGYADPRLSGVIVDEFHGRPWPGYPAWTAAVERLGASEAFAGRAFYAYCGGRGMYGIAPSQALVRAVLESGGYVAWERYLHEEPDRAAAETYLDTILAREATTWQDTFPECQRRMVMVLGELVLTENLANSPQVDFKVWTDMQMQHLATRPEFEGLYGVQWYYSAYGDEETQRWVPQLMRHYAIEGRTDLLSERYGYRYALGHIRNSDFENGLDGWTVEEGAGGSVRTGSLAGYGHLQGRYWQFSRRTNARGDTFCVLRRQAAAPNRLSQPIRGLVPGRLYSVSLITADWGDIVAGRSVEQRHTLSVRVEGGEVLPDRSFQAVVANNYAHTLEPFTRDHNAWFNHHRVVFRATAETGTLVISDWASPTQSGGPVEQELMCNFVEVQPYFAEEIPLRHQEALR